ETCVARAGGFWRKSMGKTRKRFLSEIVAGAGRNPAARGLNHRGTEKQGGKGAGAQGERRGGPAPCALAPLPPCFSVPLWFVQPGLLRPNRRMNGGGGAAFDAHGVEGAPDEDQGDHEEDRGQDGGGRVVDLRLGGRGAVGQADVLGELDGEQAEEGRELDDR